MPETSATSADGEETTRKRRRPNSLAACDGCQSRKSRCEMVSQAQCQRCLSLGENCLFLGKSVNDTSIGPADTNPRDWAAIARLEQRTSRLEALLTRLSSQPASQLSLNDREVQMDPVKEYYRAYNESGDQPSRGNGSSSDHRLGAYLHVSSILALNHWPTFADPEREGVIEGKDMRRLIEDFPRLIPDVSPLAALFYSMMCSEHPLVRSCILHNLGGFTVEKPPSRQTLANTALVLRNLAVIPAAEPSPAIAIALLILSFSPASRTDISLPRTPDPYEASSRAMRIALRLGLNKGARLLARGGLGSMSVGVDDVVLWYAISHRSAWVDLLSTDSFAARPSLCPLLCESLSSETLPSQSRSDLVYLWHESRLIFLIRPLSEAIAEAQCAMLQAEPITFLIPALAEFSASIAKWSEDVTNAKYQPSFAWLCLHAQQIKMMAFLKVSNDHGRNVNLNPPDDQQISLMRYCSSEIRRIAIVIVELITSLRITPARLPSYNLTLCFAAYALIRPIRLEDTMRASVEKFRQLLVESHTAGQRYVDLLDERRSNGPITNAPSPSGDGNTFSTYENSLDSMLDVSWMFDPLWSGIVEMPPVE